MKLMSFVLTLIFVSQAWAEGTAFIPNYYRNRRFTNSYAAIGWSDRHEAGLYLTQENTKNKTGGTVDDKYDDFEINPYIYHRFENGVSTELSIDMADGDYELSSITGKFDHEEQNIIGNIGYEFDQQPIAIGFTFGNAKEEFSRGTFTSERKAKTVGGGIGYRLDSNVYVGAGISNINFEATGSEDLSIDIFNLGIGKVYGDRKNPDAATELIFSGTNESGTKRQALNALGLINRGPIQYTAQAGLSYLDGISRDGMGLEVGAGFDYQFPQGVYVGPQLIAEMIQYNNDDKDTDLTLSVEGGYRVNKVELFVRINLADNKEKPDSGSKETEEQREVILGINSRF